MPVSKRRKTGKPVQKRAQWRPPPPLHPSRWVLKLKATHLAELRNDPDFLTLIKMGRIMNAIGYAATGVLQHGLDQSTFLAQRQYIRGMFVLAGYTHQAVKTVHGIKGRYLTFEGFEPLRVLSLDAEHKKARDYVRKIRNFTAFHLDEFDDHNTTQKTLAGLKLGSYILMAGDDDTVGTYYFDFADYIDWQFLLKTFADGRSHDETAEDIAGTILTFSNALLTAAHTFQHALWEKLDMKEHAYR